MKSQSCKRTFNLARDATADALQSRWNYHGSWQESVFRRDGFKRPVSRGLALIAYFSNHATEQGADYSKFKWDGHYPATGFAGLTRRQGRKPIIAAVNGHAHGGGFEIALNSDLVLASPNANFRLPDVLRGTAALEGAFPRICRTFGLQRAMLLVLTAYTLHVEEAKEWGLVQKIVPSEKLVEEAVKLAGLIAGMSPDSIVVSRAGVRQAWETASVDEAGRMMAEKFAEKLMHGENAREGMLAFAERRAPKWVPSKL